MDARQLRDALQRIPEIDWCGTIIRRADAVQIATLADIAARSRADLSQNLRWVTTGSTKESLYELLIPHLYQFDSAKKITTIPYALIDSKNRIVGMLNLQPKDDTQPHFEIGYWVSPEHRGQSHASNGLLGIANAVLKTIPEAILRICTFKDNVASRRTAERAQFQIVEKNNAHPDPNCVCYEISKTNCLQQATHKANPRQT